MSYLMEDREDRIGKENIRIHKFYQTNNSQDLYKELMFINKVLKESMHAKPSDDDDDREEMQIKINIIDELQQIKQVIYDEQQLLQQYSDNQKTKVKEQMVSTQKIIENIFKLNQTTIFNSEMDKEYQSYVVTFKMLDHFDHFLDLCIIKIKKDQLRCTIHFCRENYEPIIIPDKITRSQVSRYFIKKLFKIGGFVINPLSGQITFSYQTHNNFSKYSASEFDGFLNRVIKSIFTSAYHMINYQFLSLATMIGLISVPLYKDLELMAKSFEKSTEKTKRVLCLPENMIFRVNNTVDLLENCVIPYEQYKKSRDFRISDEDRDEIDKQLDVFKNAQQIFLQRLIMDKLILLLICITIIKIHSHPILYQMKQTYSNLVLMENNFFFFWIKIVLSPKLKFNNNIYFINITKDGNDEETQLEPFKTGPGFETLKQKRISGGGFSDIFAVDLQFKLINQANYQYCGFSEPQTEYISGTFALKKVREQMQATYAEKIEKEIKVIDSIKPKCKFVAQYFYDESLKNHLFMSIYYFTLGSYAHFHNAVMSLNTRLNFVLQIAQGVKFLQQANIFHLDLKPPNILLDDDCNVKICDFGESFSKAVHLDTKTFQKAGRTLPYAPIEALQGNNFSNASDVYSIGAIISEIVFDKRLIEFKRINQQKLQQKILTRNYRILYNDLVIKEFGIKQIMKILKVLMLKCVNPEPLCRPHIEYIIAIVHLLIKCWKIILEIIKYQIVFKNLPSKKNLYEIDDRTRNFPVVSIDIICILCCTYTMFLINNQFKYNMKQYISSIL